jgi:TusA-related sulfurtransferase
MELITLDVRGLRCTGPTGTILKEIQSKNLQPGTKLRVIADCPMFPMNVEKWCKVTKRDILWESKDEKDKICIISI